MYVSLLLALSYWHKVKDDGVFLFLHASNIWWSNNIMSEVVKVSETVCIDITIADVSHFMVSI